jgi:hypothetical protein
MDHNDDNQRFAWLLPVNRGRTLARRIGLFNTFAAPTRQVIIRRDTDQTPLHPRFEAAILRSLRWVAGGMSPDVGIGPYRQSERLSLINIRQNC